MKSEFNTALSTISISPHLTPVFEAFAKLRPFTYYYHCETHASERASCGWNNECNLKTELVANGTNEALEQVDVLIEGMRDVGLIERRLAKGLPTIYMSERWLKPFGITLLGHRVKIDGIVRLLHPKYFKLTRRFVACLKNSKCYYLGQGAPALGDMLRLIAIFSGKLQYAFRTPHFTYGRVPCAHISATGLKDDRVSRLRLWGYFVSPSRFVQPISGVADGKPCAHVLWVGRMVGWKRVDTLLKVARRLPEICFTLVGEGPEEPRLKRLVRASANIEFKKFQQAERVREMMRTCDAYVLTSDGTEGWGAVTSEALEEGACVYGTYEAGSSASMLPTEKLFHAGNVSELEELLRRPVKYDTINNWAAEKAAIILEKFISSEVACDFCR